MNASNKRIMLISKSRLIKKFENICKANLIYMNKPYVTVNNDNKNVENKNVKKEQSGYKKNLSVNVNRENNKNVNVNRKNKRNVNDRVLIVQLNLI